MTPTNDEIAASPAWFPLKFAGPDTVGLLKLTQADYAAASFLDERLLLGGKELIHCNVASLDAAVAGMPCRAQYIFHTGHVGSTLISRLVGAHPSFFSLREPALLRSFVTSAEHRGTGLQFASLLRLLSRTWSAEQRAVVKATSFVSEFADRMLSADARSTAVFMFAQPLAYLRGIMAGDHSRAETKLMAASRLARLSNRLGSSEWRLATLSEGEAVAMSWLCEMTTLHAAAQRHPQRILWVDFDQFLNEPERMLPAILRKLGAHPTAADTAALLNNPLMRQYSKAPEHSYDAALRREVLRAADIQHRPEIKRGFDWLHSAALHNPLVQALFEAK